MSFQTMLYSVTPAKRQPSNHMQPVLVSGDHRIPYKNKEPHLLPRALIGNHFLPTQQSFQGNSEYGSAVSFIFCPEPY